MDGKILPILDSDPDVHASMLTDGDLAEQLSVLAEMLVKASSGEEVSGLLCASPANWEYGVSLMEALCLEHYHRFEQTADEDKIFQDLETRPTYRCDNTLTTEEFSFDVNFTSRRVDYAVSISGSPFDYSGTRGVPQIVCDVLSVA